MCRAPSSPYLPSYSYHPYLFFNRDGITITFVGFNVNNSGDLIDPLTSRVIEHGAITRQLYAGLRQNKVNLNENYQGWDKLTMMKKMSQVMGMEFLSDPDPSYVLTVDNLIKILAIQMRFRWGYNYGDKHCTSSLLLPTSRCNIPVVIMGETGCGKTRLIRFMCDTVALSAGGRTECVTNMLIMKVLEAVLVF